MWLQSTDAQVPEDGSQLYEVDGDMSIVPGQPKLPRCAAMRCGLPFQQPSVCKLATLVAWGLTVQQLAWLDEACAHALSACHAGGAPAAGLPASSAWSGQPCAHSRRGPRTGVPPVPLICITYQPRLRAQVNSHMQAVGLHAQQHA